MFTNTCYQEHTLVFYENQNKTCEKSYAPPAWKRSIYMYDQYYMYLPQTKQAGLKQDAPNVRSMMAYTIRSHCNFWYLICYGLTSH